MKLKLGANKNSGGFTLALFIPSGNSQVQDLVNGTRTLDGRKELGQSVDLSGCWFKEDSISVGQLRSFYTLDKLRSAHRMFSLYSSVIKGLCPPIKYAIYDLHRLP